MVAWVLPSLKHFEFAATTRNSVYHVSNGIDLTVF